MANGRAVDDRCGHLQGHQDTTFQQPTQDLMRTKGLSEECRQRNTGILSSHDGSRDVTIYTSQHGLAGDMAQSLWEGLGSELTASLSKTDSHPSTPSQGMSVIVL